MYNGDMILLLTGRDYNTLTWQFFLWSGAGLHFFLLTDFNVNQ